ncbi:site-specific integrase [Streptomyces sp. ISL-98]|uniref:site-specific integrase n=1 Tax=Streptomyces sp. ISL-98 TaxID=2819192 RepID=UPI001BE8C101|nr:site-specific integrase [Streptomyces sp. ISL-98]MBT2509266.1 site-specific integrase [Streptomyces sp. ISL-98]
MADAEPGTWRRYAYSLIVWLDFLDAIDVAWDRATVRHMNAFKDWRITDRRNEERVRATSFDTDRAGLNTFYRWANRRFGIANPVATIQVGKERSQPFGYGVPRRDPLRPPGSTRRQVKWLLRSALEQWRDVGLRGYDFHGHRPGRWSGFNEDRDIAFVDGLYGTGLRLREWASLLDVELPSHASARMTTSDLGQCPRLQAGGCGPSQGCSDSRVSTGVSAARCIDGPSLSGLRRMSRRSTSGTRTGRA